MIKAVSFDGDDTFWSFDDMMRQALASTLTLLEEMTKKIYLHRGRGNNVEERR